MRQLGDVTQLATEAVAEIKRLRGPASLPGGWRLIRTAPQNDYEEILALVRSWDGKELERRIAMWDPEIAEWTVFMASWDAEPVYWQPLPSCDGLDAGMQTHRALSDDREAC